MGAGWIGARLSYLSALVAFQQRRTAEGNTALAAAMAYMRHGSLWLFHIGLADQLYAGGGATPRVTMDLFNEVLRDPQPADWATDPMESLAVLVTPHTHALEHWFEAAIERNETQTAMEIAERIRRRRFFGSLELGGRLESLRWVLEAAPEYLSQPAQLQRQELLTHFPAYDRLSQQARKIRATLAKMPLVAEGQAAREQSRALERAGAGQPPAGGDAAGDCLAPRAGLRDFSAAAQRRRGAEIAARQTRHFSLLRHQPAACTDSC